MDFHPRSQAFTGHELSELVAISPDDDAMKLVNSSAVPSDTSMTAINIIASCF